MIVLSGEEGLICGIFIIEMQLEHILEFKYLVLENSGTDEMIEECVLRWLSLIKRVRNDKIDKRI